MSKIEDSAIPIHAQAEAFLNQLSDSNVIGDPIHRMLEKAYRCGVMHERTGYVARGDNPADLDKPIIEDLVAGNFGPGERHVRSLLDSHEALRTRVAEFEAKAATAVCAWCGQEGSRTPEAMVAHQATCTDRKDFTEAFLRLSEARVALLEAALANEYEDMDNDDAILCTGCWDALEARGELELIQRTSSWSNIEHVKGCALSRLSESLPNPDECPDCHYRLGDFTHQHECAKGILASGDAEEKIRALLNAVVKP